jgi:hypothetical protein
MTHQEFVRAYRSGQVLTHVDRSLALRLMDSPLVAKRYRVAHLVWSWVWFLSFPIAIALMILVAFWLGLIMLVVGFMLPSAIKRSACQFVLEQALEDEAFFKRAVETDVLSISERA